MDNECVTEGVTPLRYFAMKLVSQLIEELVDAKIALDEVRGVATISGKRDGKYLSFVIEQRDLDELESAVKRKSDYKDEVKSLYRNGFKQKEIASRLNMSQSFVSRLLNSD